MRDMAATNQEPPVQAPKGGGRLLKARLWVQTAFLLVWLGPPGVQMLYVPSCVFHCYACPLASFACPVGVVANFSALHTFPLLAVGVVLAAGGLVGSLICGWACPFGWLQDLLAKIPLRKFRIPSWTGYGRYLVLVALVIVVPFVWGDGNPLFICRVCPAGAIEAALPAVLRNSWKAGGLVYEMSWLKTGILVAFVAAGVFTFRPWCTVLCPLGGALALFNPVSVFRLRLCEEKCTQCNLCRSRCAHGVLLDQSANSTRCVRCLECTACGAITPMLLRRGGR